jgi:hypothetical protein
VDKLWIVFSFSVQQHLSPSILGVCDREFVVGAWQPKV